MALAPASPALASTGPGVLALVTRHGAEADRRCADRDTAAVLLPRLVLLSVAVLCAYAAVHGTLIATTPGIALWSDRLVELGPVRTSAITAAAYLCGLFGAKLAALPSFYFYGLLAGVRTHPWRIAVEAMRSQATASAVLLGLLPVYLAAGAGLVLWGGQVEALRILVIGLLGYALPFIAGFAGVGHLYRVFRRMVADARAAAPAGAEGRRPMPLLLVMAWSALYTALAPAGVARAFVLLVQ